MNKYDHTTKGKLTQNTQPIRVAIAKLHTLARNTLPPQTLIVGVNDDSVTLQVMSGKTFIDSPPGGFSTTVTLSGDVDKDAKDLEFAYMMARANVKVSEPTGSPVERAQMALHNKIRRMCWEAGVSRKDYEELYYPMSGSKKAAKIIELIKTVKDGGFIEVNRKAIGKNEVAIIASKEPVYAHCVHSMAVATLSGDSLVIDRSTMNLGAIVERVLFDCASEATKTIDVK